MKLSMVKGFSLPAAIFVLVALSAIAIAMVTLNSVTTTTSALNIEQSRAFFAAQSGMEWAIKKVSDNDEAFNNNSCAGLGGLTSVDSFTISISCSGICPDIICCSSVSECNASPRVTILSVTASKGGSGETYNVTRQIQATISYDGF